MNKVTTILQGGQANLMFEIAAAYAYSLKYNCSFELYDELYIPSHHPHLSTYKTNIFKNIKFGVLKDFFFQYKEPSFLYSPIPDEGANLSLYGYFQSEKYFKEYSAAIRQLFHFVSPVAKEYTHFWMGPTCSIHVRRGDYLNLQECHPLQSLDYYQEAAAQFDPDTQFLIFSNDIDWCKENFTWLKNAHYVEGNSSQDDMYLQSKCSNNIITNSSFSWWGAWLNSSGSKRVIYPKKWFTESYALRITGGKTELGTEDLIPEGWVGL